MIEQLAVPARAVGGFVEMSLETFRATFRRPFQFREFLAALAAAVSPHGQPTHIHAGFTGFG